MKVQEAKEGLEETSQQLRILDKRREYMQYGKVLSFTEELHALATKTIVEEVLVFPKSMGQLGRYSSQAQTSL